MQLLSPQAKFLQQEMNKWPTLLFSTTVNKWPMQLYPKAVNKWPTQLYSGGKQVTDTSIFKSGEPRLVQERDYTARF